MGGLGNVILENTSKFPNWPLETKVSTKYPVISCLVLAEQAGTKEHHDKINKPLSRFGRKLPKYSGRGNIILHTFFYMKTCSFYTNF